MRKTSQTTPVKYISIRKGDLEGQSADGLANALFRFAIESGYTDERKVELILFETCWRTCRMNVENYQSVQLSFYRFTQSLLLYKWLHHDDHHSRSTRRQNAFQTSALSFQMWADLMVPFCTFVDEAVVECFLVFKNSFWRDLGRPSFSWLPRNSDGSSVT